MKPLSPIYPTRAGKFPAPSWLADFVVGVERVFGVRPTEPMVAKVYPQLVDMWRRGASVREAVRGLCAIRNGEIVLSDSAKLVFNRGELKPPRGAQRGVAFGYEQLRRRDAKAKASPEKKPTEKAVKRPAPARKPRSPKPAPAKKSAPPPPSDKPSLKETEASLRSRAKALAGDDL